MFLLDAYVRVMPMIRARRALEMHDIMVISSGHAKPKEVTAWHRRQRAQASFGGARKARPGEVKMLGSGIGRKVHVSEAKTAEQQAAWLGLDPGRSGR